MGIDPGIIIILLLIIVITDWNYHSSIASETVGKKIQNVYEGGDAQSLEKTFRKKMWKIDRLDEAKEDHELVYCPYNKEFRLFLVNMA